MEKKCIGCGQVMKLIPAGTSKKTGKPYKAFFSCKCGMTAPGGYNLPNKGETSVKTPISSDSGVSRKEFDELKHRVAFLEEELLGTAEIKSKDLF